MVENFDEINEKLKQIKEQKEEPELFEPLLVVASKLQIGVPVNCQQLRHWISRGLLLRNKQRLFLEHRRVGHKFHSSVSAVERFLARLTEDSLGQK